MNKEFIINVANKVAVVAAGYAIGHFTHKVIKTVKTVYNDVKIKKGLEDGSIMECDGEYYDVTIEK